MSTDTQFVGAIPEIYDRYLVPLIFQAYADDLATRAASISPKKVLEAAAGTGVVTRALARRLPESARLVVTDLNQAMVDHARKTLPDDARITWQQADALELPFEDGSFDAVVCQFGVMFFPDKVRGYREALRVLRPGGTFFFNVWDRISDSVFAEAILHALATVFPADPPRFMERVPHGYHDTTKICEELAAAGFESFEIDSRTEMSRAPSAHDAAVAYCQGTPWRMEIEARDATRLVEATERSAEELERRFGKGPIEGRIRAHVVTAVRA